MIYYAKQDISSDDIDALVSILRSDFLTQGPAVEMFESGLRDATGASHAIVCNSATSALTLGCIALGLSDADILWTSPITFVASATCGLHCGARVDFVDVDPDTGNMSIDALEAKLIEGARDKKLPKVLVVVHFAGQTLDMERIWSLSLKYGFFVLEDASHALGGSYNGIPVGCSKYSHLTVVSFHAVKLITTGEGGAILLNDSSLAARLRLLRSHGITRDSNLFVHEGAQGAWFYEQQFLGYNYRMPDLNAALGASQLARLQAFVDRRRELVFAYRERLHGLPLKFLHEEEFARSAYHLMVVKLEPGICRDELFDKMRASGIALNVHYIPVYKQPYFRNLYGDRSADFPNSEAFYACAVTLPLYPALKEEEFDHVCKSLIRSLL